MPRGNTSSRLAAMLPRFTIRSVHMLLAESCRPMNQPRSTISDMVAGAAHMRMKK